MLKKRIYIALSIIMCLCLLVGCQKNKMKGIEGKWLLNDNTYMVIGNDGFYWYESADNLNTNYYFGNNVRILEGEDALDAIKVPQENRESLLESHVYYLSVTYSQFILDGKDCSSQLDKSLSEFAFQIDAKDHVNIVNLTNNEQMTATRQK